MWSLEQGLPSTTSDSKSRNIDQSKFFFFYNQRKFLPASTTNMEPESDAARSRIPPPDPSLDIEIERTDLSNYRGEYAPTVTFRDERQPPTVTFRAFDEESHKRNKEAEKAIREQEAASVEVDENPVDARKGKSVEIRPVSQKSTLRVAQNFLSSTPSRPPVETTPGAVRKDTPASLARLREIRQLKSGAVARFPGNRRSVSTHVPAATVIESRTPKRQSYEETAEASMGHEEYGDELERAGERRRAVRQQVDAQAGRSQMQSIQAEMHELNVQERRQRVEMQSKLYEQQTELRNIILHALAFGTTKKRVQEDTETSESTSDAGRKEEEETMSYGIGELAADDFDFIKSVFCLEKPAPPAPPSVIHH